MPGGQYTTSDIRGFLNLVLKKGQDFTKAFGFSLVGIFKPFTTRPDPSGTPSYQPLFLHNVPGQTGTAFGATASGLNPFGPATQYEGVLSGTGVRNRDIHTDIDRTDVRSFGFKTPTTWVGWGYDKFGYPAPNHSTGWNVFRGSGIVGSGAFGNSPPSGTFKISSTGWATNGYLVPEPLWRAGPEDKRWDQHTGMWTSPQSVYSARILMAYATGVATTGRVLALASTIQYDVRITDGVASQLTLSGIRHVGPKPVNDSYKVYTYPSGEFAFMVHYVDADGIPRYGAWLVEMPGTTQCASTGSVDTGGGDDGGGNNNGIYSGPSDGSPWSTTGVLEGSGFYQGSLSYPLSFAQGGLGFATIADNQVLVGSGGTLIKRTIVAGTGLELDFTGAGLLTIKIASGTQFIATGLPLPVSKGGTGSTTRNYVSTTGIEVISGNKRFASGIKVPVGSSGDLSFGFLGTGGNVLNAGFWMTGHEIRAYNSGYTPLIVAMTGTIFPQRVVLRNNMVDTNDPILSIYRNVPLLSASTGDLAAYFNYDGGRLGGFSVSGAHFSRFVQILNSGVKTFEVGPSGDRITLGMNLPGSLGSGYILAQPASGAIAGHINLSAATGLNGGSIITASGGGTIDTTSGFLQLGRAESRTTLTTSPGLGSFQCILPTGGNLVNTTMLATGIAGGFTGEVDFGGGTMVISGGIIWTVTVVP